MQKGIAVELSSMGRVAGLACQGVKLSPDEAMQRINTVLAHAWMVRTFLKHAEEIQDDEELIEVPRTVFDYARALDPSYQRNDAREFLHRARGKLGKLRRAAELFNQRFRHVSDHTNFQMAALSLNECVRQIEEILSAVKEGPPPASGG
jgi:hypothetical protein